MELYSQILDNGGPAFGEILRHLRDRPQDGCLFHCTGSLDPGMTSVTMRTDLHSPQQAGKDRTAVIAAILLSVSAGINLTISNRLSALNPACWCRRRNDS